MRAAIAVLGVGLLAAGCTQTISGTAQPAPDAVITTSHAPLPPPPAAVVTDAVARGALLKRDELGAIIGDTDLRQVATFDKPWQPSTGIEPRDCAARLLFQEAIAASGYLAALGDDNRGARGQTAAQLIQVYPESTSVWPRPGSQALRVATGIVTMLNDEQCREGVLFTTTSGDITQSWTAGPVTAENPGALGDPRQDTARGGGGARRAEPAPRGCYHAVLAWANAVAESIVCGDGDSAAQANQIIDRIAERLRGR